jgi:hypothetical protein
MLRSAALCCCCSVKPLPPAPCSPSTRWPLSSSPASWHSAACCCACPTSLYVRRTAAFYLPSALLCSALPIISSIIVARGTPVRDAAATSQRRSRRADAQTPRSLLIRTLRAPLDTTARSLVCCLASTDHSRLQHALPVSRPCSHQLAHSPRRPSFCLESKTSCPSPPANRVRCRRDDRPKRLFVNPKRPPPDPSNKLRLCTDGYCHLPTPSRLLLPLFQGGPGRDSLPAPTQLAGLL